MTTNSDDKTLFVFLSDYAKDRLLGQPPRPIDPAAREAARKLNVFFPSVIA